MTNTSAEGGTWALARDLLLAPSRAARRLQDRDAALPQACRIYGLFLVASVLFYTLKPADFPPPDPGMELPASWNSVGPSHGLWFWTKVQLWNPFLSAVWAVFLAWFSGFLKPARGPLSLMAAGALGMLPVIPILLYVNHVLPRSLFVLAWIAMLAAMLPLLRKRERPSWKPLCALVLSVDIVNLALLVPFAAAVVLRAPGMYVALEMVMLFWTLGLASYVWSRLDGLSTSRAFAAIFLSMLCQFWLVFSLHFLGLVSKEILKAMMSV